MLWQGAINQVAGNATAFAQRDALYSLQYYVGWNDTSVQNSSLAWIDGLQVLQLPTLSELNLLHICAWLYLGFQAKSVLYTGIFRCIDTIGGLRHLGC